MSCLPDGECCTVSFAVQNVCPTATQGGSVTSFTASLYEDDFTSPDDPMGGGRVKLQPDPGQPGCFTAEGSGEVCNRGGDLYGPNNVDQNGGLEGGSIEVCIRIEWKDCVTYVAELRSWAAFATSGGAASGGSHTTRTVTECTDEQRRSPKVQVTPC